VRELLLVFSLPLLGPLLGTFLGLLLVFAVGEVIRLALVPCFLGGSALLGIFLFVAREGRDNHGQAEDQQAPQADQLLHTAPPVEWQERETLYPFDVNLPLSVPTNKEKRSTAVR